MKLRWQNKEGLNQRPGPQKLDKCPKCSTSPHDTPHIFNWPRDPTDLDPTSLWLHPREAAKFLNLDAGDEDTDMKDDKKMIERRAK